MKYFTLLLLLLVLSGCSIIDPMPGRRSSEPPTEAQVRLMRVLQTYRLPEHSIAPTQNPDPMVAAAINAMYRIAEQQRLVFDGSGAAEGNVIVGRMGSTSPMLLGLTVYPVGQRVAFRDVTNWKMSDMSEGARMQKRFLGALQ